MATKSDTERLSAKRTAAANKILEIAPAAELLIGMLDETKVDLILIALAGAHLSAPTPPDYWQS